MFDDEKLNRIEKATLTKVIKSTPPIQHLSSLKNDESFNLVDSFSLKSRIKEQRRTITSRLCMAK